jgi:two-component sensor histidine kinase
VWNEAGASLDFFVAPAYYQTRWFMVLSAAALIAIVWSAHRARLHVVEKHQAEISALNERLMKAQEQERIRIAGELHDGVMQEMQAVTMLLGAAKRRIPADSTATATIDKAQQKLIQAGTDLRQLSHDLHPPLLQEAGLPRALTSYCEQFSAASGIPVACDVEDNVRDLSRGAALALFRVVQEALGNAAKHAKATQIAVHLTRSDGLVSLTCRRRRCRHRPGPAGQRRRAGPDHDAGTRESAERPVRRRQHARTRHDHTRGDSFSVVDGSVFRGRPQSETRRHGDQVRQESAFILRITWPRCALTVISLMPSSPPTCLFSSPDTTSAITSRSRDVSDA